MNLVYIHQYFGTHSDWGGTRSYEFARQLLAKGHRVTMICGSKQGNLSRLPDKCIRSVFHVDGIKVLQVNTFYSNSLSLKARTMGFLRFVWYAYLAAKAETDVDLVFATSTPLTVAIPGALAAKYHRVPFVFEVRDLWPELPAALGVKNPLVLWSMKCLELWAYSASTHVIALAPGIGDGIERTGYPKERITIIPNASNTDLFVPPTQKGTAGELTLIFIGAHGKANGLDAVLNAAYHLQRLGETGIRFLFVGDGSEKNRLIRRSEDLGLRNVTFWAPVSKRKIGKNLQTADVGLMILKNVPAFYRGTSPNKFFDYLAAGLPVLNNYPGWLAFIIQESRCGIVVPPDDPVAFAEAVIYLRDNPNERLEMGRRSRALAEHRFSRAEMAEKFVHILETVHYEQSRCKSK